LACRRSGIEEKKSYGWNMIQGKNSDIIVVVWVLSEEIEH